MFDMVVLPIAAKEDGIGAQRERTMQQSTYWTVLAALAAVFVAGINQARAQGGPAAPQPITFADLDGHVITAMVVYARTLRRLNDGRVVNNTSTQTTTLTIGPGDRIDQVHAVSVTGKDGRPRGSNSFSATFQLNKPRKGRVGEIIWIFEEGKLVRLQTFESGGRRITIALNRSPNGLSCTVDAPFAQEEGAGPIQNQSALGSHKVQLLSVKQTESRCRIVRKE